jgi:hypothetical protein
MIPLCIKEGDITQEDMDLWERVVAVVNGLKNGLTCHQVCEEVSQRILELQAIKGKFLRCDHSWLVIRKRPWIIIDAYPWATGTGPFMVTSDGLFNPWRTAYKENITHQKLERDGR